MFETRVKSNTASFALALIHGARPVACSSAPVTPDDTRHFSPANQVGDYTIGAVDHSLPANLDDNKLLGSAGPYADSETRFDVVLEFQDLGIQFEEERSYGYMWADRTFTNDHRVGIRFRFQF